MTTALSALGLQTLLLAALAQPTTSDPAATKDPLNEILHRWEKAMGALQTYVADVERIDVDKTFQTAEVHKGILKARRAAGGQNEAASLYLARTKATSPTDYDMLVWNGKVLYVLDPPNRLVRRYKAAPALLNAGAPDALGVMSAIKADALRDRFKITYQPTRADMPAQKAWHYLQFEPKLQGDKTIFSRARVVLNADTYFPGEIRLEQPNGNEMIWRFRNVNINVQLNAPEFLRPVPAGWDLKEGN